MTTTDTAGDDWLDDADPLVDTPDARRALVERALVEVLLPRVIQQAPRPTARPTWRTAALAAAVVIAAVIVVLLVRPRGATPDRSTIVAHEPGARAFTVGDHTILSVGGAVIETRAGERHTIDTPLGPVALAPATRVTLRSSAVPPALYIDVATGEATVAGEVLPAGERRAFGDLAARRRLGPRITVRILQLDARRLEAELPSGAHATYVVSTSAEIDPGLGRGDTAELVLSPSEKEVFVIRR
jgi:hypothetical protein